MPLLSFDTSSEALSVAILDNGNLLGEANLQSESALKSDRQQSVSLLMPTIDDLMRRTGVQKTDLRAIVAGVGPGGFTGVRVTVVTGRTLAQALKLPLIGINSLEVLSHGEPSAAGAGVIKVASKSHFFIARYERCSFLAGHLYDLKAALKPTYVKGDDFETLLQDQPESRWFCEEAALGRLAAYSGGHSSQVRAIPAVNNIALCQAKIGHVRLSLKAAAGEDWQKSFAYQAVQPLYLRGASVTLKKGDVIERVEAH